MRGLVYLGLGHWWDLATSGPRGRNPTHTQLAWKYVEERARPIHNRLAEHQGIRQAVTVIIKYICATAFDKRCNSLHTENNYVKSL